MSVLRLLRRGSVAVLVAGACHPVLAHSDDAAAAARIPQRVALLARAQSELERGAASAALDDFERASMMLHAADAELGLIRAAMQDGQYRRALAFCAHTAGEHTGETDGATLYAWLLRVGGQGELARRTLADARAHAPGDALADAVDAAFATSPPTATGVLLEPLRRMAPWPVMLEAQSPPPEAARFVASAVLVDDGASALVPASTLPEADGARVWVRNGLGQTTAATVDAADPALAAHGLARLRLQSRLSIGRSLASDGRAPFAGSPGYTMQFGRGAGPAWPMLAQGFLGGLTADSERRKLGFEGGVGAAVLDAKGALAGIVLTAADGQAAWVPLAALAPASSASQGSASAPAARPGLALVAPDEIYELGLRRTLQVLSDTP